MPEQSDRGSRSEVRNAVKARQEAGSVQQQCSSCGEHYSPASDVWGSEPFVFTQDLPA